MDNFFGEKLGDAFKQTGVIATVVRCPNCDRQMKQVTARANPGQLIILDQCRVCGGVWCDKWELFPVDFNDAEKIDSVDQERLKDLTPLTNKPLYCPRCTAALQFVAEPMLPDEIQLRRCLRCDGIWLNRGQMRRYKKYQQQKQVAKLGKNANPAKLSATDQRPNSWVVTGTGGIFAYPQGEQESNEVVEKSASAAGKIILQSLLRLILGI